LIYVSSHHSTTSSATSFFSDGDAGIGSAAPQPSLLTPDLNGVAAPITTTTGQILGHLNLSDGLVHGIDGYIIGTWLARPPFPFGFWTSPSNICLDAPPTYLSLPSTIKSTQLSSILSTEDFDVDSAASTHWPSPSSTSSVTGNWEPDVTPTSLDINDVWDCGFSNSVSEGTWAEGDRSSDSTQSCWQLSHAPLVPETVSATLNVKPPTQAQPPTRFLCGHCIKSFKRDSDRFRHERSIHSSTYGRFVCPITGCPSSQGAGYCRADKVKEHLWKKHRDLGYVKGA
jgi:hypothetical protein